MSIPWVFLCGLLCDRTIWTRVVDRLGSDTEVHVISFAGLDSIQGMAESVLDRSPTRFQLAGHSMGGRVALEVVSRAPDRIAALALLNTGVHEAAKHEEESRGRLVKLAYEEGMERLAEEWLPPMMGSPDPIAAEILPELSRMVQRFSPQQYEGQIRALLSRPDAAPILAAVRAPTLLLSGTNDRWSPLEQHRQMLKLVPHASLVAIENAGHMSPIEAPEAVAQALATFSARKDDQHDQTV